MARCAVITGLLVAAPGPRLALAATTVQDIHSTGALTDVWIGTDLSCQIAHSGRPTFEFFPPASMLGDCGTFLSVGGTLFGPDFDSHPDSSFPVPNGYTPFTAVSQSGVTGAGTAASPYRVVTTVSAGNTGLSLYETDSYVTGDEIYRTDIAVANSGSAAVQALLYRGADCYLQGSDTGFGFVSARGAPSCAAKPNNSPSAQIQELSPLTPGFRYVEGLFTSVWGAVIAQTGLPNTCACTSDDDDGAAINWDISVPAGAAVTYSILNNFSATGQVVGAPAAVTGPAAAVSTAQATLTGSVNPGGEAITDCRFLWGTSSSYGRTVACAESAGAGTAPVAVSATLPALAPGTLYHYRLSATSGGGTTTGADQTFTTDFGPPAVGRTANLIPLSGEVLVKVPTGSTRGAGSAVSSGRKITKGRGFVPLTEARQVPMGSQIDARRGTLELVAATARANRTQTAHLAGGLFGVSQIRNGLRKGLTTFTLKEGLFPGAPTFKGCPARTRAANGSGAGIAKASKKALQTLRASDNHGRFRTKGRFSAGTVRGTKWTTTDRCDGTLTKVKRGTVDVLNFGLRKRVAIQAGYTYLAKAAGGRKRKHR